MLCLPLTPQARGWYSPLFYWLWNELSSMHSKFTKIQSGLRGSDVFISFSLWNWQQSILAQISNYVKQTLLKEQLSGNINLLNLRLAVFEWSGILFLWRPPAHFCPLNKLVLVRSQDIFHTKASIENSFVTEHRLSPRVCPQHSRCQLCTQKACGLE